MKAHSNTIAIAADVVARYEELARATGQSREQLVEDVLRAHLLQDEEDMARVAAGIADADEGRFASDQEMEELFAHYGGLTRDQLRAESARDIATGAAQAPCE